MDDLAFVAGAASAARALGYRRVAEIIEREGMDAEAIIKLFNLSVSRPRWRDASLILIAGSVARYRARPDGWDAEPERSLVLDLLCQHKIAATQFKAIAKRASSLVIKSWPQIERQLCA